jgi:TPR repeat protein
MYHQKDAKLLKSAYPAEALLPKEQVAALNSLVSRISTMDNMADSLTAQFSKDEYSLQSDKSPADELRNIIHAFRQQSDGNIIRPIFNKSSAAEVIKIQDQQRVIAPAPIAKLSNIPLTAKQLETDVFPDHFKEMANKLANMQNVVLTRSYLALVVDIQNQLESLTEAVDNGRSEEKLRDQSKELRARIMQASKNFPACAEPLAQSLEILDELTMKLDSFSQISYGHVGVASESERDAQFSSAIASQKSKSTPQQAKQESHIYEEPAIALRISEQAKPEYKPSFDVLSELFKLASPFMPSARHAAIAIVAVLLAFPAYQIFNSAKSGLTNLFTNSNSSNKFTKIGTEALTTSAISAQKPTVISTNTPVSKLKTARSLDVPVIPQELSNPTIVSAIAAGDGAAMYELGMKLREGRGVERDATAALNWFKAGAESGNIPSTIRYAKMLEKGEGGIKDLSGAMSFYQRAADKGSREATHALAALFASGSNGNADFKQAFTLFDRAARAGYVDSQYNLGVLYAAGQGVKPNLAESYKWFSIAAQGGDKNAATSRDEIARQLDPQTLATTKAQLRKINLSAPSGDVTLAPRVDVVEE